GYAAMREARGERRTKTFPRTPRSRAQLLTPRSSVSIDGKFRAQRPRPGSRPLDHLLVLRRIEHVRDQVGELARFREAESAGGDRRRTEPDAARDRRLLRIVGDRILVDRDVRA